MTFYLIYGFCFALGVVVTLLIYDEIVGRKIRRAERDKVLQEIADGTAPTGAAGDLARSGDRVRALEQQVESFKDRETSPAAVRCT
jgi:hypothetical protein